MLNRTLKAVALAVGMCCLPQTALAGALSDNIRIASKYMGYDLQYRVYTPDGIEQGVKYPILLLTDGQWYIRPGEMVAVLDELMEAKRIEPFFAVFVDSRNPDDLDENRRNEEFMCNPQYVNFYTAELLPSLYEQYPISVDREDTSILGLSFGGLNSACFGVLASNRFYGIGMHSPASARHLRVVAGLYEENDTQPLKIFLSAGTVNDNLRAARRFRDVLERKGCEVTYIEATGKAHNWENWGELLDDALLALLPAEAE